MFDQGVICGVAGMAVLLADLVIWRRMEHKAPIKLSGKTLLAVFVGILGALLLGVGMCLTMVFGQDGAGDRGRPCGHRGAADAHSPDQGDP